MPPMWSSSSRTRLTNLQPHRAPLAASASCSPCLKTSEWHSTGTRFIGNFETLMEVDGNPAPIDFHREGYLWLGSGRDDIDSLTANWRVQTAHDARVELLDRRGVKHRFPSMRVDDIDIAAYSPDDGYMDPHSVLTGFRRKATSLGITYLKDRVVDFEVAGKRVAAVRLESGQRLATESIVNAANCWGPALCEKPGMKGPV